MKGNNIAPSEHVEALDGLRGTAILLVLCFHYSDFPTPHSLPGIVLLRVIRSGWVGVDLFFVLSGFLITRLLLESRSAHNYFKVFYARRALRLFPVYYLAVVLMFWMLMPLSHRPDLLGGFFTRYPLGDRTTSEHIWYWLNISNLRTAFYPTKIPLLTVFWSLAIEEQFYFVWPACVRLLPARRILLVCVGGLAAILVLRNLPPVQAENKLFNNFVYRMTPFHMDGLFCGSALGVIFTREWQRERVTRWAKILLLPLFAVTVLLLWSPAIESMWMPRVTFTVLALLFGALLWLSAVPDGPAWMRRLFQLRPLRNFGRYSYFIYVFHLWVITYLAVARDSYGKEVWPFNRGPWLSYSATVAAALATVYGLGALSARYFEGPFLGLKRLVQYRSSSGAMR